MRKDTILEAIFWIANLCWLTHRHETAENAKVHTWILNLNLLSASCFVLLPRPKQWISLYHDLDPYIYLDRHKVDLDSCKVDLDSF